TITDANNCVITNSFVLTQPLIPTTLSVQLTPPSCFGYADGSIDLTVVSGNASLSYLWSNNQTTQDLNNIPAGTYFVTVTDNLGCVDTLSAVLNQPNPLAVSAVLTNPSCVATNNGVIDLTVTGGTAPYSFVWLTGQTTEDLANLVQGTYFVTITDTNGCSITANYTLVDPTPITASYTFTPPSCHGGSNATVDVTVNGGFAPYTYQWYSGPTTEDLINVPAGNDTLYIVDANNCPHSLPITVTQPDSLQISFNVTNIQPIAPLTLQITGNNITCFGATNGNINLTPLGGTSPYTFNWNNGAVTEDLTGLSAGNYYVTVTDSNGCQASTSLTISTPAAALTISNVSLNNVQCYNQSTGFIDLTITGGAFPYAYAWSNATGLFNASTQDIFNIPSDDYTVIITDFNGCVITANYSITQPPSGAVISSNVQPVFCFGDSTGWINASVIGGALPYSFAWSNGVNAEDLYNIPAGTYVLNVTDNVGCVTTASIVVAQPNAPLFSNAIVNNQSCFGSVNASINANLTGGTAPYTLSWNTGQSSFFIGPLVVGQYDLHVDVACHGDSTGYITALPNGGTAPYSYSWSNGQLTQVDTLIPAGSYVVTVTDDNGCVDSALFDVLQPAAPLSLSVITTAVGCFGANSGAINLTVNGGTPGYSYLWSNNATSQDIQSLTSGNYAVAVTDQNGCMDSLVVNVAQPQAPLMAMPNITNAPCFGLNGGAIDLNVAGGTFPYSYFWNTGDTLQDIDSLLAGQYTV
ncbi:MAG: hypothetical protein EB023_10990, partial [Flavobacteriia bacterium]|nr:hypothetical protein [Flavobacteriia bacterium]